jgi:hypothetical protein
LALAVFHKVDVQKQKHKLTVLQQTVNIMVTIRHAISLDVRHQEHVVLMMEVVYL